MSKICIIRNLLTRPLWLLIFCRKTSTNFNVFWILIHLQCLSTFIFMQKYYNSYQPKTFEYSNVWNTSLKNNLFLLFFAFMCVTFRKTSIYYPIIRDTWWAEENNNSMCVACPLDELPQQKKMFCWSIYNF